MKHLEEIYTEREASFKETAEALTAKFNRFSFIRLFSFIIGVGIIIFLFSKSILIGVIAIVLFLLAFGRFVKWHQALQIEKEHFQSLTTINGNEVKSLNHDYSMYANGESFQDPLHPYTVDLDIFGDYSVFQYLNRNATAIGEERLANYLSQPAQQSEILARQEAIAELKDQLDWRQNFQAYGMSTEDNIKHLKLMKIWLEEPNFVVNNSLYKILMWVTPILAAIGTYCWIYYLPWYLAILFFVPAVLVLKKTLKQVNTTHNYTNEAEKILAYYARMIGHIEGQEFKSEKLRNLQSVLAKDQTKASKSISKLSYIISQLNIRYNAFAIIINIIGLWDLHWVLQLEKWRAQHKDLLPHWFDSLAEFEALLSCATVYYNNPEWVFPTISEETFFEGIGLGHPLLHRSKRITNELALPTHGHLKLITGSNMAGKSTFLRTAGLNIVMAMTGLPVCAKSLRLPVLQVYTSMRTQDALHESTSSFYAELKRLKQIIEAVEGGENVFFLLDEILKGTNSNDRHTGSKALIKQLIAQKGSGLIATHDLELGALEATYGGAVENLCMEVAVNGDELIFDYKIKKGVSQSFNATQLMRQMGIRI